VAVRVDPAWVWSWQDLRKTSLNETPRIKLISVYNIDT
jgi:hypothetical protein